MEDQDISQITPLAGDSVKLWTYDNGTRVLDLKTQALSSIETDTSQVGKAIRTVRQHQLLDIVCNNATEIRVLIDG